MCVLHFDITDSSEVPGAKLIILDKDGKKVESWTSTDKPHMVEKLPVGEYTLREEQAPEDRKSTRLNSSH